MPRVSKSGAMLTWRKCAQKTEIRQKHIVCAFETVLSDKEGHEIIHEWYGIEFRGSEVASSSFSICRCFFYCSHCLIIACVSDKEIFKFCGACCLQLGVNGFAEITQLEMSLRQVQIKPEVLSLER